MQSVTAIANSSASTIGAFIGNFLALIIITAILFFFTLRVGRSALIAVVLSLYAGFALYSVFPYTDQIIATGTTPLMKAIAAIIVYGVASFVPYLLIKRALGNSGTFHPLPLFVLSLLTAGFILALGYHLFAIGTAFGLGSSLEHLFAPKSYFFWWFIAPLVGLFVFAR